jgi:pimeloyl-ACP methyl ester carboxylesterase
VGELRMPLLAVAGEADDAYVEPAYRLAGLARNGTARLVPGAGHAPQLEQPDGFARILDDFLEAALTVPAERPDL